jgi:hypothetical protein
VRRSLQHGREQSLHALLQPFFARADSTVDARGNVHASLLPPDCDNWMVTLDSGRRCDGRAWADRCPLSMLIAHSTALLHHTTDGTGGADAMFSARHRVSGEEKLVLLQLKNRAAGGLADALRSIDLGTWYTDFGAKEQPAHAELRAVLAQRPGWALPVRVVVGVRRVDERVLHTAAWLCRNELKHTPVLFVQVTADNIGAAILAPRADVTLCSGPQRWPQCLWPTAVRHWEATKAPLPSAGGPPARDNTSLRIALTSKAQRADIEQEMCNVARKMGGEVVELKARHFALRRALTVTFSHAAAALKVMALAADGRLRVGDYVVEATFAA